MTRARIRWLLTALCTWRALDLVGYAVPVLRAWLWFLLRGRR